MRRPRLGPPREYDRLTDKLLRFIDANPDVTVGEMAIFMGLPDNITENLITRSRKAYNYEKVDRTFGHAPRGGKPRRDSVDPSDRWRVLTRYPRLQRGDQKRATSLGLLETLITSCQAVKAEGDFNIAEIEATMRQCHSILPASAIRHLNYTMHIHRTANLSMEQVVEVLRQIII